LLYRAEDFSQALADLNQAIALNRKVADVFCNRAYVLFNLQRPEEAMRDLETAMQL
jgi:tetratricopeptide (TPR) repeat protein